MMKMEDSSQGIMLQVKQLLPSRNYLLEKETKFSMAVMQTHQRLVAIYFCNDLAKVGFQHLQEYAKFREIKKYYALQPNWEVCKIQGQRPSVKYLIVINLFKFYCL